MVTDPADMAWMDARRHPHPLQTLLDPMGPTGAGDRVHRSYIRCTRRHALVAALGSDPLAGFVDRARREAWPVLDLDAPHAAHVVAPDAVGRAVLALTR